ncbi:MAG: hypothetical protein IKJ14_01015 [Clostridia bacterium]|nr:hypothetical protein [Clostridia bacterium]
MKRDKMTTVRINSELFEKFKQTVSANNEDITLADLIEIAMKNYIKSKV